MIFHSYVSLPEGSYGTKVLCYVMVCVSTQDWSCPTKNACRDLTMWKEWHSRALDVTRHVNSRDFPRFRELCIHIQSYIHVFTYIYIHIYNIHMYLYIYTYTYPCLFWNPKKARACAMSKSMGFVSSEAHGLNMFKQCCFLMFFVFSCLFEGM